MSCVVKHTRGLGQVGTTVHRSCNTNHNQPDIVGSRVWRFVIYLACENMSAIGS